MLRSSLLCSEDWIYSCEPTANVNADIFIALVNNPDHGRSYVLVLARNVNFGICCTYHSIVENPCWQLQQSTIEALRWTPSETHGLRETEALGQSGLGGLLSRYVTTQQQNKLIKQKLVACAHLQL